MGTCQELGRGANPFAPAFAPANQKNDENGPLDTTPSTCDETAEAKPQSVDSDFTAALMMLAKLPLSDEERAEAVRRLLTGRE